jgi:PAS domain S-box-containing protein
MVLVVCAGAASEILSTEWLSDVFLCAAVALLAYAGGWVGAVVAVLISPFILVLGGDRTDKVAGEWLELTMVAIATVVARDRARETIARKRAEDALREVNVQLEHRVEERVKDLNLMSCALRRSEELPRTIVEQAKDIIFTLDSSGTITSLNPVFERIVGWPPESWIGRCFSDLICDDARSSVLEVLGRVSGEETVPLQRVPMCGRNRRIVVEVSIVNLIVDGRSTGFLGLARDVTDRDRAAEELRNSERRLAESQRIAMLGSFEIDLVLDEVVWSDEHYRLFGVDKAGGPMTRERFLALLTPDQHVHAEEQVERVIRDGEAEWELTFGDANGVSRVINVRARLLSDEEGRPVRILGTAQDVTERRRAEQFLRETEERFNLMGRATNDLVWDWDLVNDITWRGEGIRSVFGYSPEEATDPNFWSSRIHPDDRDRVLDDLDSFIASRESCLIVEYRVLRRDGTYVSVLERGYAVRAPDGTAVRMVGATMDVTARKQMEEDLARANRVSGLGRIAASIAHEFNNVLMGLQPNLEVLERRAPVQLRTFVDHMLHSVSRGKRVTDEILNFTRRVSPSLEQVDVSKFMKMWEHEIRPSLGPGVVLDFDVAPGLFMRADGAQLVQVLTNLAINARDAMPQGGTLTIRAAQFEDVTLLGMRPRKQTGFIQIRVSDTGTGMPAEALERVFEPMFTTKAGGLGLGLAVAYQIVSRHEGLITAKSRVGAGTTFNVLIPAMLPEEAPSVDVPPSRIHIQRLLIVEDEVAVAEGLKALLELDGHDVDVVNTAGAAIPAIERIAPDVLILDIGLPDMNGIDLYEEIEKRWPSLPVIFSSGHGDESRLLSLRQRPHIRALIKPYDFSMLERALGELAGGGAAPGGENTRPGDVPHVM